MKKLVIKTFKIILVALLLFALVFVVTIFSNILIRLSPIIMLILCICIILYMANAIVCSFNKQTKK